MPASEFIAWSVDPAFVSGSVVGTPPGDTSESNSERGVWAAEDGKDIDLSAHLISVQIFDNDGNGWLTSDSADRVVIDGITHRVGAIYVGDKMTVNGQSLTVVTVYLDGNKLFSLPFLDDDDADNDPGQLTQAFGGSLSRTEFVYQPSAVELDFAEFNDIPEFCLLSGMRILGAAGLVAVEDIGPGDLVMTLDHGLQPVIWTRHLPVRGDGVRISAGALGEGRPARDLLLSAEHRVLVELSGGEQRLLAARHLLACKGIRSAPGIVRKAAQRFWVHLLLAQHEILLCEGVAVESLYAGPQVVGHLPARVRAALVRANGLRPRVAKGPLPGALHTRARPFAGKAVLRRVVCIGGRGQPALAADGNHDTVGQLQVCWHRG